MQGKHSVRNSEKGHHGLSDEEDWYGFGAVDTKESSQSEGVLVKLSDRIRRFGSTTLNRMGPGASANSSALIRHFRIQYSALRRHNEKGRVRGEVEDNVRVVSDKHMSVSRRIRPSKSGPRLVIGLPLQAPENAAAP